MPDRRLANARGVKREASDWYVKRGHHEDVPRPTRPVNAAIQISRNSGSGVTLRSQREIGHPGRGTYLDVRCPTGCTTVQRWLSDTNDRSRCPQISMTRSKVLPTPRVRRSARGSRRPLRIVFGSTRVEALSPSGKQPTGPSLPKSSPRASNAPESCWGATMAGPEPVSPRDGRSHLRHGCAHCCGAKQSSHVGAARRLPGVGGRACRTGAGARRGVARRPASSELGQAARPVRRRGDVRATSAGCWRAGGQGRPRRHR